MNNSQVMNNSYVMLYINALFSKHDNKECNFFAFENRFISSFLNVFFFTETKNYYNNDSTFLKIVHVYM